MYVFGRFNVVQNHLPSIHMYADDIQLCLSFMPLSTSRRHGALRTIQALVSHKNSWDPSTQHRFYFWPVSWSSQCWLSQLTHHILHTNIGWGWGDGVTYPLHFLSGLIQMFREYFIELKLYALDYIITKRKGAKASCILYLFPNIDIVVSSPKP